MNAILWIDKTEDFPCPTCKIGRMIWISKNVVVSETLESKRDNEFHEKGIVFPYTTALVSSHLICDHCKDVMLAAYKRIDDVRNVDEEGNEINIYEVLFLDPASKIISIPETCTQNIRDLIEQSFKLF